MLEASGLIGVWDVSPPARPQLYASIAADAIDACFSPDGAAVLTVGWDGRVRKWTTEGQLVWISGSGHAGPARGVVATADFVVSGGEDGAIRFWKPDGSAAGPPLSAHTGAVVSIAISPSGDIVSFGADESVRLWNHIAASADSAPVSDRATLVFQPRTQRDTAAFQGPVRFDSNWGWVHALAFSPSGDAIAGAGLDDTVRLWNADGSTRSAVANAHERQHVRAVAFSPTGDVWASAGWDGKVRLWNLDGSPRGEPVEGHQGAVLSVSFSARGDHFATASIDDRVFLWNVDGSPLVELPPGRPDRIVTVALSPLAPTLAAADDNGTIRLWDLNAIPRGKPLVAEKGAGKAMAFSPRDAALAAGGTDGTVRLWNRDGSLRGKPSPKQGRVEAVAFSPDGTTLAIATETLELWDRNGILWQRPAQPLDSITKIAFGPKGEFVATGSFLGRLQVWNADGSTRMPAFKLPQEYTRAVAVSPDGSFFASTGGDDPAIRLWNLDGSPNGAPLEGHRDPVDALAFSPTQSVLVSGSQDGTVRLWHMPKRESDVIDVGVPVNQLGFWLNLLWVRANGDSVFFYDRSRRLVATMLLRRDAALTFTPDGWFSASDESTRFVRVFRESGEALPDASVAARRSPEKVLEAFQQ